MESIRERLGRTSCACRKCQLCCQHMPGMLIPEDLPHFAPDDLRASPGALVVLEDGRPRRIRTITPAARDNGTCIFFRDGRCAVHELSPAGCACTDMHADARQADRVSQTLLSAIMADWEAGGPYSELWGKLKPLETTVEERREALATAIAKHERKRRNRR